MDNDLAIVLCVKYLQGQNALHNSNLFKQSHQVIEELLFDDLTVLPVCDSAELDMKLLVGWCDQLAVGTLHPSLARSTNRQVSA